MRKKTVDAVPLSAGSNRAYRLTCSSDHPKNWIPVTGYQVTFPVQAFRKVCDDMVLHPEWNSSSILRCDILDDDEDTVAEPTPFAPAFDGFDISSVIRRRILPKRPMDAALEQICYLYDSNGERTSSLLLMLPVVPELRAETIPYYHPQVAGIAFVYTDMQTSASESRLPWIQVNFLPLDGEPVEHQVDPLNAFWAEDSRTYRTALQLLTVVAKHGKTATPDNAYVKRVQHDQVVEREIFQDAYKAMKSRYTWIIEEWKESTDPLKHVLEDVAIATFLICLWKDMYPASQGHPPGGFVDVGCGNGLLVYILQNEGFEGYGLDLRARKSWALWGAQTRLETTTLSPPELCLSKESPFPHGSFLIGNHADELTPWLPLLATVTSESAFINIPCCMHTFTGRFVRQEHAISELLYDLPHARHDMKVFDSLSSEKGGRYAAYIAYVTEMTIRAGWRPEREALRIPSTKNWALIGRKRIWADNAGAEMQEREIRAWIEDIAVQSNPMWKPREAEGKDH